MDWSSPEIPSANECVLGPLLRRRATEQPDRTYAVFGDGSTWTYAQTLRAANAVAWRLSELGVRHGDRVLSWLPNGPDALRVWFGINLLGAIYVPLNPAYRGRLLEHAISLSGAKVMVAAPGLLDRLDDIEGGELEHVVRLLPETWPDEGGPLVEPDRPVEPWDPYAIILTSGTTGPSKGVVCSYVQLATSGGAAFEGSFGRDDRYMVNLPLFHAGGTVGTYAALLMEASIALVDRFDTSRFWETIRETGTTHVTLLGVMATFLAKQPHSPQDRDNPLRHVFMVPLIDDVQGFATRFGVEVVAMFNMTETSIPIISEVDPPTRGTCGRVREGVEARVVDEHDRQVPDGTPGELVLRTDRPWAMNSGYWGMPSATARAWRNGWFHTGDAFRRDADGEFFFVDRVKDTIRRRGENISSFDVEIEVLAHPRVGEAAVVAVPSPHGEDDVLAVVAPVAGQSVDPGELISFLIERLAYFMVPRYVRVLPELPKTPTAKIEKHRLRAEGVAADTWDREAAGIRLRHEPIAHPLTH
ncbi:ATP-dependent acyl-CoA ligase [Prauserella marina]|uniref:Crotonobetaine/carnitine-CoA ligase n=1 Tax=Prauserella marina TaxID=530584 RepID=A0A222VS96_9PSEU|nr:AMP-binding protein [Prauserella marina]ASR36806.1 ATP-dependent acyl-CoA ligase [Prauserella marina]PWV80287.1 crotonobetaine/carnitine-CoA ligase [Prauserella marina]SDD51034.1 crotonobetaine/carnitine-CoA ligase [Prauserella marina]